MAQRLKEIAQHFQEARTLERADILWMIREIKHLRASYVHLLRTDEQNGYMCPTCGGIADNGYHRGDAGYPYSCITCYPTGDNPDEAA